MAEVERPGDLAVRDDVRVRRLDVEVIRIGLVAPHIDKRPAAHVHLERRLVDRAVAQQPKRLGRTPVQALGGVDRGGEPQLALHVLDIEVAARDDELLDRRQLERLAGLRAVRVAEVPVRPALGVRVEDEVRLFDVDQRHVDPAGEQRQQLDVDRGAFDRAERLRTGGLRPVGLADEELFDDDPRCPGQEVDAQVAVDAHLAVRLGRRIAADRTAQGVPVEQGQHQHDQEDHRADDPADDLANQTGAPLRLGGGRRGGGRLWCGRAAGGVHIVGQGSSFH